MRSRFELALKSRIETAILKRSKLAELLIIYAFIKNALLEKIEETKLVSERLRAEYEALRKIEQNQNVLLQQLNS